MGDLYLQFNYHISHLFQTFSVKTLCFIKFKLVEYSFHSAVTDTSGGCILTHTHVNVI